MESISEQLKRYRARARLTQDQLGAATGVTGPQIAHVEGGKRNLSMTAAVRAADALGLTEEERVAFLEARRLAASASADASASSFTDPLLEKVKLDQQAALAWGSDQSHRLSVVRRLYELSEQAFYDEMLDDMIRDAASEGDPYDLVTHVEDRVNDYVRGMERHFAEVHAEESQFAHAAHDDEDGSLDGRTETPVEETPEV